MRFLSALRKYTNSRNLVTDLFRLAGRSLGTLGQLIRVSHAKNKDSMSYCKSFIEFCMILLLRYDKKESKLHLKLKYFFGAKNLCHNTSSVNSISYWHIFTFWRWRKVEDNCQNVKSLEFIMETPRSARSSRSKSLFPHLLNSPKSVASLDLSGSSPKSLKSK